MSGTISGVVDLFTTWASTGSVGRDTPATVRNLIESLLADYQATKPDNLITNAAGTAGAVLGTSGGAAGTLSGTLPTGAFIFNQGNLVTYVAAIGVSATGYGYWDLNISGTSSTTSIYVGYSDIPSTASLSYTAAMEASFSSGSLTNVTGVLFNADSYNGSGTYINSPISNSITLTSSQTLFSGTGTPGATSTNSAVSIITSFAVGAAINVRLRIANPQFLLGSAAGAYTAAIGDRGSTMRVNAPSAFTVTIPHGVFSAGMSVAYRQAGPGAVTVQGDGTSVLVSSSGTYATRALGSRIIVTADMTVPNLFWVDGDLS